MYDTFLKTFIRLRHSDEGATLVEYGIALTLAITIGTAALVALAGEVSSSMGAAGTALPD